MSNSARRCEGGNFFNRSSGSGSGSESLADRDRAPRGKRLFAIVDEAERKRDFRFLSATPFSGIESVGEGVRDTEKLRLLILVGLLSDLSGLLGLDWDGVESKTFAFSAGATVLIWNFVPDDVELLTSRL